MSAPNTVLSSSANHHPLPVPRNNNNNKNNNNNNSAVLSTTSSTPAIKDKINIYNKNSGIGSSSVASTTQNTSSTITTTNLEKNNNNLQATTRNPPSLPPRPIKNHSTTTINDGTDNKNNIGKEISKKKSLVDSALGFSKSASKLAFPAKTRQTSYNNNISNATTTTARTETVEESPRSNSGRFSTLESIQRRASSITQEVSRRTSVMTVFRPKKSSTVENQKPLLSKTSDLNIGQNGSSRQLSARLSYARTASERTLARAGRKKSENIFTKQEQRSIRLAATEARIIWDDDNSRTSDDTSIVSDEDGKSKRSTLVEVQNMYKDNQSKNFEMINPSTSSQSSVTNGSDHHHFGMLIFTESRDNTVIEEEEED